MLKDIQQRDHTAVTPTDHAYALRVEKLVILEHPFPRCPDVVHLASAVVDLVVEACSIPCAAPIIRPDHRIALLNELAHDVEVVCGSEVCMNATVCEHNQRMLFRPVQVLRD